MGTGLLADLVEGVAVAIVELAALALLAWRIGRRWWNGVRSDQHAEGVFRQGESRYGHP